MSDIHYIYPYESENCSVSLACDYNWNIIDVKFTWKGMPRTFSEKENLEFLDISIWIFWHEMAILMYKCVSMDIEIARKNLEIDLLEKKLYPYIGEEELKKLNKKSN